VTEVAAQGAFGGRHFVQHGCTVADAGVTRCARTGTIYPTAARLQVRACLVVLGTGMGASGKNSRYFHTLGYENIFLQKSDFLHTQKILFHTLKNNFIPSKKKLFSYLKNFFHTPIQKFHTL
jgi:hypothetical protein